MLRLVLPIFPDASDWAAPFVVLLAVVSIVYGALVAIGQTDMNRLIAYTSVSSFILLSSSLSMVLALAAAEKGDHVRMRLWLLTTAFLGLAFVGLSSGTLSLLASVSTWGTTIVLVAMALGVLYPAWLTGADAPSVAR